MRWTHFVAQARWAALGFAPSVALSAACTSEVPDYTPDADTGSTHAVVVVERSESAATLEDDSSAEAIAQFVSVPAYAEADAVLRFAGTAMQLPELGQCEVPGLSVDEPEAPTPFGPVEFLEVGEVSIQAGPSQTLLARHAFPNVGDFASGVVYTTLDRSAELPAATEYAIGAEGTASFAPIRIRANAPAALDGLSVSGVPVAELESLSTSAPVDLTWSVGSSSDTVYVEVVSWDGAVEAVCAFADSDGVGTLPAEMLTVLGPGSLNVHRLRSTRYVAVDGVDTLEFRFDFELTAAIEFVE